MRNRSMPPGVFIPELAYADVREAAAWLCAAFGFRERLRIGDHRIQLVFAGASMVVVQGPTPAANDHSVMVSVDDVDAHFERARRAGAAVSGAPVDHPFGERQYSARDLAAHRWVFSQSIADSDPRSWGGEVIDPDAEDLIMLTKAELVTALQNEVRITLHLASKIDRGKLDYRPTPKQRSTLELLRYLSMMGPTLVRYVKTQSKDGDIWMAAAAAADKRDADQAIAAIADQSAEYAALLADMSDADLRGAAMAADGSTTTRGAALITGVLASCVAYRMQLFLYLKSSGREELGTMNLWAGVDAPATAHS